MPTTLLKITADELKAMVNPADDPALFRYGNDPELMSEASVISLIEKKERGVLSQLPEHYRNIVGGTVDGQILLHKDIGARGGETTLQLAFYPVVEDTPLLYLNYLDHEMPWGSRGYDQAMDSGGYSVNDATGVVTLTAALSRGDQVFADYKHDGGALIESVRDLVLEQARVELYSAFPNWSGGNDTITDLQELIDNKILSFNLGERPRGIAEIDNLEFVVETRKSNRHTIKMPYMRGAI